MLSKKILLPVVVTVIVGATAMGINQVHAQTTSPLSGLAQAIAQKFSLNQTDVQSVIATYMQQQQQNRQQKMQARIKTRLDKEVQQGKITSAQETAIINELAALKNKYNPSALKTLTPTQRQQTMQNMQTDLKTWAQQQGVNWSLIPNFGTGLRHGWRFGGPPLSVTPTS